MALNSNLQTRKPNQLGTGYTNIQRILQANKSNQLGSTVAQGVQQAGQAARGSINQAGQAFATEVDKERARQDQEKQRAQRVIGDVTKATDDDVASFEAIRSGQSKGPTGVSNAEELRSKAGEAESLGQAAGSEAGRFGLLQRYVGGGKQYTGGQQRMDALLLGQTGGQQLRQARKSTLGLGDQQATQEMASKEVGKTLQNKAQNLKEETVSGLGRAVTDYDAAMQAQLDNKIAGRQSLINSITGTGLQGPVELDEKTLKDLSDATGGYLTEGKSLMNVDLSPFIKANLLNASKQGAQNTDDLKRAQMIAKLSGEDLGKVEKGLLQSYVANPELAGTFDSSKAFDASNVGQLDTAIQNSKRQYDDKEQVRQNIVKQYVRDLGVAGSGYSVDGGLFGQVLGGEAATAINRIATNPNAGNIDLFKGGKEFLVANYGQELYDKASEALKDTFHMQHLNKLERDKEQLKKDFGVLRTLKKKPV